MNDTSFTVLCPLEEGESTSFLDSIYQSMLNWITSEYSDSGRFPFDTDVNLLDYSSSQFDLFSVNCIVLIMYTAGCYFVFFGFLVSSLGYIHKWTSRASKYKIVSFFSALLKVFISINKIILLLLVATVLVSTTYLYMYYNIPSDVINNMVNNIELANKKYVYIFSYIPMKDLLKVIEVVMIFFLGVYRYRMIIRPLEYNRYSKFIVTTACIYIVQGVAMFVTNIVQMSGNSESITLIEVINGYNACVKLVFYSLIILIITITIEYICYKKSSQILEKIGNTSKYTIYNITLVFVKVVSTLAFFSVFIGIIALYGYYLPSEAALCFSN